MQLLRQQLEKMGSEQRDAFMAAHHDAWAFMEITMPSTTAAERVLGGQRVVVEHTSDDALLFHFHPATDAGEVEGGKCMDCFTMSTPGYFCGFFEDCCGGVSTTLHFTPSSLLSPDSPLISLPPRLPTLFFLVWMYIMQLDTSRTHLPILQWQSTSVPVRATPAPLAPPLLLSR